MNDQELAQFIDMRKGEINELTGKPYGLRAIAEELGLTYGKVRWVDSQINLPKGVTHPPVPFEGTYRVKPVVSYVWDLETTNLNTFMGQLIAASFLDLATGEVFTRNINDFFGRPQDKEIALLEWVLEMMEDADILIGHNTIGFDMGFLRGRLAIHGLTTPLPRRQHWDTYQIARHGFKGRTQGYSLENLADFFRLPVGKDKPSKHDWAASIILDEDAIERITERCEADVLVNAYLWEALRPYHHLWKGR
jgi:DNA polymerase elongation subunit (family B)